MSVLPCQWFFRAVTIFVAALLFALSPAGSEAAVRRGQPGPSFKLFAINGQPVSSEGLKGSVVVLDFWATWCPHCRDSIPFLSRLHRTYAAQGLQVVGMSADEGGERVVRQYVEGKAIPYLIVMANRKLLSDYSVRALPVVYILDRHGIVREQFLGFSDQAGAVMEALVKKLLAEK